MDPKVQKIECTKMHSNSIEVDELQLFDIVIFLGGCTGRQSCAKIDLVERTRMNVNDVIKLVQKMNRNQHFIVASTSAVTEGMYNATEQDPIFVNKHDEYTSSMFQRELALRHLSTDTKIIPRISILRFGTVIGVSPGQRVDLLVPSLYTAAYKIGVVNVQSFSTMRSFLWLRDLTRAVNTLVTHTNWDNMQLFKIWNLASFSSTVLKVATTVSSITGALIDTGVGISGDDLAKEASEFKGFSLNCDLFESTFNFSFKGDLQTVLIEFDQNIPDSITAKGAHITSDSLHLINSIPCPVCGSDNQQLALDLGDQPFANDFLADESESLNLTRYPLKLVRCRRCNHLHLSHIASRKKLFGHYLYRSGTSKTLASYFQWLSNLVIEESGNNTVGSVIEIACNDGSQLDEFQKRGWKTFGVDPAANIVPIAQQKGHTVRLGFWNEHIQLVDFPKGEDLTAIVAQNVFAHVPNPVAFLKACAAIMGPSTLLYIQTSQCNMHQLGQFHTAYHEHISFFTGHSFLKASELAGLYITSFRTTPIHGTSCLVTMKLPAKNITAAGEENVPGTLQDRLKSEKNEGILTDFFYDKYAARAQVTRAWIVGQVNGLKERGYSIGAYGAAAKGMTLLHYMLDDESFHRNSTLRNLWIDFVIDDAPLKQNTYCPGTSIPVFNEIPLTDRKYKGKGKLAVMIFAWNFWEEIANKIKLRLWSKLSEVLILLPFPTSKLLRLNMTNGEIELLREVQYTPTKIPNILRNITRKNTHLVTHQRNEEMLMPFFILQHSPMFDHATLIDFESTDQTREIIEKYAPASWKIVKSTTGKVFDAKLTDAQVMHWENEYPHDWAIALTTTEFLVYDNFRQSLFEHQPCNLYPYIHRFNHLVMVGNDTQPLKHFSSLLKQRHQFQINQSLSYLSSFWIYGRHLHINSLNYKYGAGRHWYARPLTKPDYNSTTTEMDGFIVKWKWTPWPESMIRKTQVGETIPARDIKRGMGAHHTQFFSIGKEKKLETMTKIRRSHILARGAISHDLCDDSILSQMHFEKEDIERHPMFQDLTRNIDFVAIKRIFHAVRAGIAC